MPGPSEHLSGEPSTLALPDLISALDTAVVAVLESTTAGDAARVTSAALVDSGDLATETTAPDPVPDVYLVVGASSTALVAWLDAVAERPARRRPVAVLSKTAEDREVRAAARRAAVTLVAVHPKARWDQIFPLIQRILGRGRRAGTTVEADGLMAADTDLFDLAQLVAANAGGLVSIEDSQSRVLAYSASDESADELRTLSILGRAGPREYLRALQKWGVFDRLRETDDVIEVPAHDGLQTRRRLVVSVRDAGAGGAPRTLGSIWVQEGAEPFSADAGNVLRGASAVASRIMARVLDAPTTEGLLAQRLFGARGGGVDIPTVASALNLATKGPAAVLGFAPTLDDGEREKSLIAEVGGLLRLHASSFRRDAVTVIIGERAYVLLPQYKTARGVSAWARQIIGQFDSMRLRTAIALPVSDLSGVPSARTEVDRVLDASAGTFPEGRVTTLEESLTPVLLGEIIDVIAGRPDLIDPRLVALDEYDRTHDGALRASVRAYLAAYGDVRQASRNVNIHPNTLRYRLRRVEEILGIELSRHPDRLLLELQLAVVDRGGPGSMGA